MKAVTKLAIVDDNNHYLMMYRSNHPRFGDDPDLPGGIIEEGESATQATLREVWEETGVMLDESKVSEAYAGDSYSQNGTHYSLFVAMLDERPAITMSWEHSSYEWLPKEAFIATAKQAKDTYMHMVADVLGS